MAKIKLSNDVLIDKSSLDLSDMFIVDTIDVKLNSVVQAGGVLSQNVNVSKTGYKPIGVVGYYGAGNYGDHLAIQAVMYTASSLYIRFKNNGSGATSASGNAQTHVEFKILYQAV